MSGYTMEEILHPNSIAVVGASETGRGRQFLIPLLENGFKGKIYPVNSKYGEIAGMPAYPRVSAIPGSVDYVISSIPAQGVLEMIGDCAQKGVKAVHLYTARFSETGRKDAAELEREVLKQARKSNIRIIGPNCMGLYYPKEGISFNEDYPMESGKVGLMSQSGNIVGGIVTSSAPRGIRFSKAISYGNAIDFNECDYLDYFAQDSETEVILIYLEGVKDGKRFPASLRQAATIKPVIVLKGGRGEAGARATASHTASMAGSQQIWQAVVRQAGAISVNDLEEFVDMAVTFNFLPPATGRSIAVGGGAGGTSVLSADQCEEAGLNVAPLPQDLREALKNKGIAIWDWIGNPADFSISMGDTDIAFEIGEMMAEHPIFNVLMSLVSNPWSRRSSEVSLEEQIKPYLRYAATGKPLALVFPEMPRGKSDEDVKHARMLLELSELLIANKMALYPSIGRAARALSKMIGYYEKKEAGGK